MQPHAYPFLMLDRVLSVEPGHWAVGLKNVTADDPLLGPAGMLAPVLVAEAMAQTAGVAATPAAGGARPAVLARIDRFRCWSPVLAGDQLLVTARVVRHFGALAQVRASVRVVGRRRCAAAELVLHFPAGP